ncbi:MAG: hypothetical protein ACEPOV_11630 [Hyphomicrobiales bacterium]
MKIDKRFNQFTYKEYIYFIDNHKKYKNFNTLALYRSIIENKKLNEDERIKIRDYSNKLFYKFFEFLKVKDLKTYVCLITLGKDLTPIQFNQLEDKIHTEAKNILRKKRIKYHHFGVAIKYDDPENHQNSFMIHLKEHKNLVDSNHNSISKNAKSTHYKKERKNIKQVIQNELEE